MPTLELIWKLSCFGKFRDRPSRSSTSHNDCITILQIFIISQTRERAFAKVSRCTFRNRARSRKQASCIPQRRKISCCVQNDAFGNVKRRSRRCLSLTHHRLSPSARMIGLPPRDSSSRPNIIAPYIFVIFHLSWHTNTRQQLARCLSVQANTLTSHFR